MSLPPGEWPEGGQALPRHGQEEPGSGRLWRGRRNRPDAEAGRPAPGAARRCGVRAEGRAMQLWGSRWGLTCAHCRRDVALPASRTGRCALGQAPGEPPGPSLRTALPARCPPWPLLQGQAWGPRAAAGACKGQGCQHWGWMPAPVSNKLETVGPWTGLRLSLVPRLSRGGLEALNHIPQIPWGGGMCVLSWIQADLGSCVPSEAQSWNAALPPGSLVTHAAGRPQQPAPTCWPHEGAATRDPSGPPPRSCNCRADAHPALPDASQTAFAGATQGWPGRP